MKIIAAIQILIKLFTIGYGAGAVRTTGRFAAPAAAGKRADTCGFYPLNSRFPLFPNPAQTRDRRPLRKGERQRILSTVGAHNVRPFLYLYAVSDFVLLHRRVHLRRRDITVSRNSLAWIFCTTPTNCTRYTVGCDDSAHRLYPTCTIYPVGRPLATHTTVNRHVNFPLSILNYCKSLNAISRYNISCVINRRSV